MVRLLQGLHGVVAVQAPFSVAAPASWKLGAYSATFARRGGNGGCGVVDLKIQGLVGDICCFYMVKVKPKKKWNHQTKKRLQNSTHR